MRTSCLAIALLVVAVGSSPFKRPKHQVISKSRLPNIWSDWSDWSECSQECNGKQHRIRRCIGGLGCADWLQERDCNLTGNGLELSARCPLCLTPNRWPSYHWFENLWAVIETHLKIPTPYTYNSAILYHGSAIYKWLGNSKTFANQ